MKTYDELQALQEKLIKENPKEFLWLEIVGKLMATRREKHISRSEWSRLSDVSIRTIVRMEEGEELPEGVTVAKLAKALQLKLDMSLIEENKK